MKKFKFNLEPLLKIRKIEEDKMLKELSKVTSEINKINDHINENLKKIQDNKFDTNNFKEYQYKNKFLNTLINKNKDLKIKLEQFSNELKTHRNNFIKAKNRKKVLEFLKENKYKEYNKKYNKKERVELEEYYSKLRR